MNAIESNGVAIVRMPTGVGVMFTAPRSGSVLVEVVYNAKELRKELISTKKMWRDYFGSHIDHLRCSIRVSAGGRMLAELGPPDDEYQLCSFMVPQGHQHHITESSVSVPPALTITDEVGAIWTLGFQSVPEDQAPKGEFAFAILRDGVDIHEVGSRIERRNGKIRIFTKTGWKVWNPVSRYFF